MLNGDIFAFENRYAAEDILDTFREIANHYGQLSVGDVYDIYQVAPPIAVSKTCGKKGWTARMLKRARIVPVSDRYLITMPPATDFTEADKNINKEDKTMSTDINKTCDYTATPEELELEKAAQEARDEAEKKIMDIRIELSKKLEALRTEYHEKEAIKREERQAHVWKRRYDALLKEGFSVEQAWEMTMKSFEVD